MTIVKQMAKHVAPALWAMAVCVLVVGCATSESGQSGESGRSGAARSKASEAALPRDPNALLVGAELALQRKQYLQAARWLAAAAAGSDDESLAERAATVAFEHHQNTSVLRSAKRWLELNSSSEHARRFAGFAALRLYRIDEAAEHFHVLIDSAFISPQAGFIALAPQWFEEGSSPAVLALMQKLIQRHDATGEAQFVLAQAALQAESIALALSSAQRAVELSPYWGPARSMLARVQLAAGQNEIALATSRATLEQDDRVENRLEYAQLQYAAGKQEEGRRELETLSASPEVGTIAQRSLALIDLDRGQIDVAEKRWRDLVKGGRFVYEGLFYLGKIAERRGETADAIELYTRVAAGDLSVGAHVRAALLKSRAGSIADGLAVLNEFGKEHPEHTIELFTAQAALLADMGNIAQGVEVLDDAFAQYPDHDALRVSKALLLERGKRSTDAIKVMRALVRDRPNDPTALNMLGYTLVDRTRNVDEGLALIRRALEFMPDNGAILDSMGWALHQKRSDSEALEFLQRAHTRARDPEIASHLGQVLWALGRRDEAQAIWEQVLAEFPEHEGLKELVRKHQDKQP